MTIRYMDERPLTGLPAHLRDIRRSYPDKRFEMTMTGIVEVTGPWFWRTYRKLDLRAMGYNV